MCPDFGKEFYLQTDASNRGVGAVLSQLDADGLDHPVAFYSRKLLPREEKYSTIEKECLTICLGVQAFCVYLLGRPFTIQTDHRSLEWLERNPMDASRGGACLFNHSNSRCCTEKGDAMVMLMHYQGVPIPRRQ